MSEREQERAAVVAWLKERAKYLKSIGAPYLAYEVRLCARLVRAGEHLKERT